jgi:hypothetical protein
LNRREFITLLGGGAGWSFAALAQNAKKIPRIEYYGQIPTRRSFVRQGLREYGYIEGQNIPVNFALNSAG